MKRLRAVLGLALVTSVMGAEVACTRQSAQNFASTAAMSRSGWFHVIWNGEPEYIIADDQSRSTRLLIAPELLRGVGGPLALNRKRVTIVGELLPGRPDTIRVLSIHLE